MGFTHLVTLNKENMKTIPYKNQRREYHRRIFTGLYKQEITLEQAFWCVFGYLPSFDQYNQFQERAKREMMRFVPAFKRACIELTRDKIEADLI